MKRRVILCAIFALVLCLCAGCTPYSELVPETPRDVLDVAMYVLTGGASDQPLILGSDGQPAALAAPTGLAGLISKKVTYQVESVQENGDSALAVLNITAPNTVALVSQALEGMESYDEAAFTEKMEQLLREDSALLLYTVEVQLRKVDGTWCMILNDTFSNAITGGLMEKYSQVQQAIYDAFAKGGEG